MLTDNSERAFYKELVKVIEASDVILEVLDARDPLGTRCVDMEKMFLKSGPDKHLVLLLNKIGDSSVFLLFSNYVHLHKLRDCSDVERFISVWRLYGSCKFFNLDLVSVS